MCAIVSFVFLGSYCFHNHGSSESDPSACTPAIETSTNTQLSKVHQILLSTYVEQLALPVLI